jgi:DNA (cytosine-5)-methyltransferase 1
MPTVEVDGERYLLDIRFRMLKPHELAAAQGFPRDYKFTGNTTQVVKQIGNAVPKNLSKALVKAALTQKSS